MQVIEEPEAFQRACDALRAHGGFGFVPTMGALHAGHLSLVDRARDEAERCAVSIFVNPTQFGPGEDLARYPRTLDADLSACEDHGVDVVFAPVATAMYAKDEQTRVHVSGVSEGLCGASRPGHFDGVCTVVSKLFGLSGACTAVFGRKDYQQLRVIQTMVRDLFLPVRVVGHPIVREADGLALSSRNRYLSPAERERALALHGGLQDAHQAFTAGERSADELSLLVKRRLTAAEVEAEYVACVDPTSLQPLAGSVTEGGALLLVAAFVGSTRLIDNLQLAGPEY